MRGPTFAQHLFYLIGYYRNSQYYHCDACIVWHKISNLVQRERYSKCSLRAVPLPAVLHPVTAEKSRKCNVSTATNVEFGSSRTACRPASRDVWVLIDVAFPWLARNYMRYPCLSNYVSNATGVLSVNVSPVASFCLPPASNDVVMDQYGKHSHVMACRNIGSL